LVEERTLHHISSLINQVKRKYLAIAFCVAPFSNLILTSDSNFNAPLGNKWIQCKQWHVLIDKAWNFVSKDFRLSNNQLYSVHQFQLESCYHNYLENYFLEKYLKVHQ
jgi:hypothetical protein